MAGDTQLAVPVGGAVAASLARHRLGRGLGAAGEAGAGGCTSMPARCAGR